MWSVKDHVHARQLFHRRVASKTSVQETGVYLANFFKLCFSVAVISFSFFYCLPRTNDCTAHSLLP